jgi:hypothetical protein
MKDLEFTQQRDTPGYHPQSLGIERDDESALAIGMFSGNGGHMWPGIAEGFGDTVAGEVGGCVGESGRVFFPMRIDATPSRRQAAHPPGELISLNRS